jgi:diguanylate cyclase (GGDEF)-like protein
MDVPTIGAGVTALAGLSIGCQGRRRAQQAETQTGRLHADLRTEHHAARHDAPTGLPNRRGLHQLATALLAQPDRHHLVAAIVDLDDFKQINDRYGHAVGDQVLATIAQRFAGRLGGDEFAGPLHHPNIDEHLRQQAGQRPAATLAAPVRCTAGAVTVTASVGLATTHPSGDLADVLHRADTAMYHATPRPGHPADPVTALGDHPRRCRHVPATSFAGHHNAERPDRDHAIAHPAQAKPARHLVDTITTRNQEGQHARPHHRP